MRRRLVRPPAWRRARRWISNLDYYFFCWAAVFPIIECSSINMKLNADREHYVLSFITCSEFQMVRVFLFLLLNFVLTRAPLRRPARSACASANHASGARRVSARASHQEAVTVHAVALHPQVCKRAWNCDATAMICTQGPPGGHGEQQDKCNDTCKPNDLSSPQKNPSVHPTISSDIVVVSIVFACLSVAFFIGFIVFQLKKRDPYVPFACSCSYCVGLLGCLLVFIVGTTWTLIFCLLTDQSLSCSEL